jgi:hypothetical protein
MDFVLIDLGTSPAPPSGARLQAFTDETPSAELAVSSYQQRPFLIADIVSGAPRVGDMVVLLPKTTSPAPSPNSETLQPPDAGVGTRSKETDSRSASPDYSSVPNLVPGDFSPTPRQAPTPMPASTAPRSGREKSEPSVPNESSADPNPASKSIIPGLPYFGKKPSQ